MTKIGNSVGNRKECYGCGVCATLCSTGVLSMEQDHNGFYVPRIVNEDACTGCGLCTRVCNYGKDEMPHFTNPNGSFSGWSKDEDIRQICSSGGIAFEIGRHFIDLGYKICAVKYNPQNKQVEHYIAQNATELLQSVGSKYLQSNTLKAFSDINLDKKNVIFGTPCQIDMWRRYLRLRKKEDNFVLVDFFCHGVPSKLVWDKYTKESSHRLDTAAMVTWRDKQTGWHSSWNISAYNSNKFWKNKPYYRSSSEQGDGFYFMFLGNGALNPACYADCKYKKYNSSADIRLGDLWGKKYADNYKGVSGILTFTEKGKDIIQQINISKTEITPEIVTEGQIPKPLTRPWYYGLTKMALRYNILSIKRLRRIIVLSEIMQYQLKKLKHQR